MTENLIIISAIGLLVGFILSIPAGGPISIVIFTNALKGRIHYCNFVNLGACIADFVYVFISAYGLSNLYSWYKPYIPYLFIAGSLFVIYISYKISKTKLVSQNNEETHLLEEINASKRKNGFITGIMLGFLNPGLFISWMASTLMVLSFLASYGFDTGGLELKSSAQLKEIRNIEKLSMDSVTVSISQINHTELSDQVNAIDTSKTFSKNYPFLLSLFYALFIAFGSVIWFYYITLFLAKFRKQIKDLTIHRTVQGLGIVLFLFGLFLGYKGISMLI